MAKKPKTEKVELRIPVLVLAQIAGVAAYAGVTVEQVVNVWLATDLLRNSQAKTGESDATK